MKDFKWIVKNMQVGYFIMTNILMFSGQKQGIFNIPTTNKPTSHLATSFQACTHQAQHLSPSYLAYDSLAQNNSPLPQCFHAPLPPQQMKDQLVWSIVCCSYKKSMLPLSSLSLRGRQGCLIFLVILSAKAFLLSWVEEDHLSKPLRGWHFVTSIIECQAGMGEIQYS